ncbi:hypothetical protein [Pelagicoccus sp. SDUM812003]|uniref:hypothetical protein n=1 Tax=Pelagicoccus sp. SDUM812003 TaxID=3041267 RepID=UPI00280CC403|nr:hypothetical protein [Pelagicoccus sp. SDUM812003]MDQ8205413.1 hypothetical protein [Pelagicoccus sp. SDUM812003]
MNYKVKLTLVWAVGSLFLGWATAPVVEDHRLQETRARDLSTLSAGLGEGVSIAALGGYSVIAANMVWVSMYSDWQYRRTEDVLRKLELAVALNPHSEFFWIDGARILANDMPVWEVGDDFAESLFETEQGIAIRRRYARKALAFLEKAPRHIAQTPQYWVEKGTIYWRKLDDLDAAIMSFAEAVDTEGVPYFVCRVYAELLVKDGQIAEAYRYLSDHYDSLPDDELSAMKPVVRQRLLQLREMLETNRSEGR